MTVNVAKINLQLPGLQKGVEAERNSEGLLQNSVRLIMTITFSMCSKDCRQREFTKFIFWHLAELFTMFIYACIWLIKLKRNKIKCISFVHIRQKMLMLHFESKLL